MILLMSQARKRQAVIPRRLAEKSPLRQQRINLDRWKRFFLLVPGTEWI